jgi:drug/metabolite transporter (DMT)-like permease
MARPGAALGVASALFYIVLWASAYVPSKFGVLDSSPLWFLVCRFTIATLILAVIAFSLRAKFPRDPATLAWIAVLGLTANVGYLGFTYEALRHLAAGVGAIVASTNPLMLAIVAPFVLHERLTVAKAVGLVLGFGGVVAIMLARTGSGTARPVDVMLALFGVVTGVISTIVFKRYLAKYDLAAVTTLQFLAALIFMLPLAIVFEGAPHAVFGPRLVLSFTYLVLVISIGASFLWFWILRHGEASRVSAYYFLTPIFGLLIAAVVAHEPLQLRDVPGLLAITIGIALAQRPDRKSAPALVVPVTD